VLLFSDAGIGPAHVVEPSGQMRQVSFCYFKVIIPSFCCVLEGHIAHESVFYFYHL